jgi:hemerythrin
MNTFVWDERYIVGIEDIDEQHKRIVQLIDDLYSAMSEGKGADSLKHALQAIDYLSQLHFRTEMRYMVGCKYPGSAHHVHQHEQFVTDMDGFLRKVTEQTYEENMLMTVRVAAYLYHWLTMHIQTEDQALFDYYKKSASKPISDSLLPS